jgi:hypothetical protein
MTRFVNVVAQLAARLPGTLVASVDSQSAGPPPFSLQPDKNTIMCVFGLLKHHAFSTFT